MFAHLSFFNVVLKVKVYQDFRDNATNQIAFQRQYPNRMKLGSHGWSVYLLFNKTTDKARRSLHPGKQAQL